MSTKADIAQAAFATATDDLPAPALSDAGAVKVFRIAEGGTTVAVLRVEQQSKALEEWCAALAEASSITVYQIDPGELRSAVTTEPPLSTAQAALVSLRERLAPQPATAAASRAEVSEAIQQEWISSGLLISPGELAAAWGGRTRQALEQAVARGDLFSLKLRGRRWYPAAFRELSAESVKRICQAMKRVDPVPQFLFWNRPQGALAGQTLAQAIHAGKLTRAVQLAEAFAEENAADAAAA